MTPRPKQDTLVVLAWVALTALALWFVVPRPAKAKKEFAGFQRVGPGLQYLVRSDQELREFAWNRARSMELAGPLVTDAGLASLEAAQVETLWLKNCPISDRGLTDLKRLPSLADLLIEGSQVTDAGLAGLQGLPNVRSLALWGGDITDAGVERLRELSNLERLALRDIQLSDTGLGQLKVMPQLRALYLQRTTANRMNITSKGLDQLNQFVGLQDVSLYGMPLGDRGLASLKELVELQKLDLWGTEVTDAGLEHLRAFPKLQKVQLPGSGRVSQVGVDNLQKVMPALTIVFLNGYYRGGAKINPGLYPGW